MPAVNPYHHCSLCKNRRVDGLTGTYCGLTGEKPSFSVKCDRISMHEHLEDEIKSLNEARYLVLSEKGPAMLHIVIYLLFSLFAFAGGYYLMHILWESGWVSLLPFLIMALGFVFLRQAVTPYVTYRKELRAADDKLYILDTVLGSYNIRYETADVKLNKDLHGNKDVIMNIHYFKA